jgi:hypothetical protein
MPGIDEVIKKSNEAQAARKTAKALKADDPKRRQNFLAAIALWNAAAAAAAPFDKTGAQLLKEEAAADHRDLKEQAKAAQIEEDSAGAVEKLADAAKAAGDPTRAKELYDLAQKKYLQAKADRNAETPANAAQAAIDDAHATTAGTNSADMQKLINPAAYPSGHP